jgi:Leucine-rich repeat (LRR) protein
MTLLLKSAMKTLITKSWHLLKELLPEWNLTSLGNLKNLTWLDLSDNNLEGSIPSTLDQCSRLAYLVLARSKLSRAVLVPLLVQLGNCTKFCNRVCFRTANILERMNSTSVAWDCSDQPRLSRAGHRWNPETDHELLAFRTCLEFGWE